MIRHTDSIIFAEQCNEGWMLFIEGGVACVATVHTGVLPDHTGNANVERMLVLWNAAKGIATGDLEVRSRNPASVEDQRRQYERLKVDLGMGP
jgi:hypothetical protein